MAWPATFVACPEHGIVTHLGDAKAKQATASAGRLTEKDFAYDAASDTYTCPPGQELKRRRYVKKQRAWEYGTARSRTGNRRQIIRYRRMGTTRFPAEKR